MIQGFLQSWLAVLAPLAAVIVTARISIFFLKEELEERGTGINVKLNTIKEQLASSICSLGNGTKQIERLVNGWKDLPSLWKDIIEQIRWSYHEVTGYEIEEHIALEPQNILVVRTKILSGLKIMKDRKDIKSELRSHIAFLEQYSDPNYVNNIELLYLDLSNLENRIRTIKRFGTVAGRLSLFLIGLVILFLSSIIMVIHGFHVLGYIVSILSLFMLLSGVIVGIIRKGDFTKSSLVPERVWLLIIVCGSLVATFSYAYLFLRPIIPAKIPTVEMKLDLFQKDRSPLPSWLRGGLEEDDSSQARDQTAQMDDSLNEGIDKSAKDTLNAEQRDKKDIKAEKDPENSLDILRNLD